MCPVLHLPVLPQTARESEVCAMRVLIGCERSGVIRQAFRQRGHDAWSCDLVPADDGSEYHLQADVLTVLDRDWDIAIFHPDCTYLANSQRSSGCGDNQRSLSRVFCTERQGGRHLTKPVSSFAGCLMRLFPGLPVRTQSRTSTQ